MLKKLPTNQQISLTLDENHVELKAGSAQFKLSSLDTASYPGVEKQTTSLQMQVGSIELANALKSVQGAMSRNEQQPVLMGINIDYRKDTEMLIVTATDKRRIHRSWVNPTNIQGEGTVRITLGVDTISSLIKLIDKVGPH